MLVICVRRKYVTLIYDTTQAGGGLPGLAGGLFTWGGGLQILSKITYTQNVPVFDTIYAGVILPFLQNSCLLYSSSA